MHTIQILDRNPTLHFHLLQLHLIELIRHQRIPEALLFAQAELAPRGEENPQFLKELERTMALLAFEMPSLSSSTSSAPVVVASAAGKKGKAVDEVPAMPESISSLLDQSQRLKTATELNAAILTAQSHGKDPKLPGLMKMLVWGESLLNDKGADFPKCELVYFCASPTSADPYLRPQGISTTCSSRRRTAQGMRWCFEVSRR